MKATAGKTILMIRKGFSDKKLTSLIMVTLLLVFMTCCATGCRPTDVLKDIVHDPSASETDYSTSTFVNSPDAEKEAPWLPASTVEKSKSATKQKQNIVVYGKKANSTLPTRHTVFDTDPELRGVASSDSVTLYGSNSKDAIDHDVDNSGTDDSSSKSSSKKKGNSSADQGTNGSSGSKGGGKKGDSGDNGGGKGEGSDKGTSDSGSGGYGGITKTYVPGESLDDDLPHVNSVAAVGQAAVLVQAIGGEGALCAMDSYTYNGTGSTASGSFKSVFSDELASGFSKDDLLWSKDGTEGSDITDIDKLVEACGKDGVIIVSSDDIDINAYFTKAQATKINDAGITVVPISFKTAQSIEEAVTATGKILSQSSVCAQNSMTQAEQYRNIFDAIIKACAKLANGGELAASTHDSSSTYGKYSKWTDGFSDSGIYSVIATDYATGLTYTNQNKSTGDYFDVNVKDGMLFAAAGYKQSPLSLFMQAAGVVNESAEADYYAGAGYSVVPIWQYYNGASWTKGSWKYPSRYTDLFKHFYSWTDGSTENASADLLHCYGDSDYGLGSRHFPYLIVSGTDEYTGSQVKKRIVASSQTRNSAYYTWTRYYYGRSYLWPLLGPAVKDGSGSYLYLTSSIGLNGDGQQSVFGDSAGTSLSGNIRVNPTGLLSSWTTGSVESVLESVWLTDIYSEAPATGDYTPSYNMDSFSVTIGGTTCTTLESAIEAFYKTVYRYSIPSDIYKSVVTDD